MKWIQDNTHIVNNNYLKIYRLFDLIFISINIPIVFSAKKKTRLLNEG